MPPMLVAVKAATLTVTLFAGVTEGVAVYSVVEIGPNLLALGTSIIGAVVLIVQLRMAGHVRETKAIVKDSNRELKEAALKETGPRGTRGVQGNRGRRGPEGPEGPRGPGGHNGE